MVPAGGAGEAGNPLEKAATSPRRRAYRKPGITIATPQTLTGAEIGGSTSFH